MPQIIDTIYPEGLTADYQIGVTQNITRFQKNFELKFMVLADNKYQTHEDIMATPGLPFVLQPLLGARCRRMTAKEENTEALLWEVNAYFDTQVDETVLTGANGLPLPPPMQTPDWSWDFETEEETYTQDPRNGFTIRTSSYEQLYPTRQRPIPILTITRYEYVFSPLTIIDYVYTTNSQPFWGAPAGSALMKGIRDTKEVIENQVYRRVTYTIAFKVRRQPDNPEELEGDWLLRPLDQGQYFYPPGSPTRTLNLVNGRIKLCNLDGTGGKLPDTAEPFELEFGRYRETDFNALLLGPW